MPRYRIQITKAAEKDIRRLPGYIRQRVRCVIRELDGDPRPATAKELRDLPGYYRIRLDRWRIIYRIEEDVLSITPRSSQPRGKTLSRTGHAG